MRKEVGMDKHGNERKRGGEIKIIKEYGSVDCGDRRYTFCKVRTVSGRVLFAFRLFKTGVFFKQFMFEPQVKAPLMDLMEKGTVELHEMKAGRLPEKHHQRQELDRGREIRA